MEVLVLAASNDANTLFDAVLSTLQTQIIAATAPIEILSSLPEASAKLRDNQLIVSRARLDKESLSAIIGNQKNVETPDKAHPSRLKTAVAGPLAGPFESGDTSYLLRKIGRKSKKIRFLSEQVDSFKAKADDAMQKAQHLEMEQNQFFDDVRQMKVQFDKLAENHSKLMWEYLPARDPTLRAIPKMVAQLPETGMAVGKYPLEQVLGYGQYAVVYTSCTPEHPDLAIKAIDKQKLVDLVSLHRISSEISSLSDPAIRHSGILELVEVIHTRKHVYLVTERGGKDLFEFFGDHTDGLKEEIVRPLLLRLAQAVEVLHRNNYCHRDLKPENVLYAPEDPHLIKLIDFGLCTKAVTEQDRTLHDFCGSPGFFAPELLLHDSYDGCKADVWSIGCILLELVLGNTVFSSIWMPMYELSVLKEPKKFAECVKVALARTRDYCHGPEWKYSVKLRNALLAMLCENPSKRFSITQVLDHPWLAEPHTPSHPTRKPTSLKTKLLHGPSSAAARISDTDASIHPIPSRSLDYPPLVSSAPGSPRHATTKISLPSLSPDKLAFSVTGTRV